MPKPPAAKKAGTSTKKAAAVENAAPVTATAPGLAPALHAALTSLVTATNDPAIGFLMLPESQALELQNLGFAEVHPDMRDEQGNRACRSTQLGADALTAVAAPAPAPVAPVASPFGASAAAAFTPAAAPVAPVAAPTAAAAPVAAKQDAAEASASFNIVAGVPMPAAKRFGKTSTYPFDSLQVNQSFFVPATAEKPNPAKSMASTVNSAKGRYMVEDGKNSDGSDKYKLTRDFALRRVEDGAAWGHPGVAGAAVWRTA